MIHSAEVSTVTEQSIPPATTLPSHQPNGSTPTSAMPVTMEHGVTQEPAEIPPDYETYYALGVAYKNMGLYEEAKAAFHVSMGSDSFYLDSALMTAICLKEEQQLTKAMAGLETVLADLDVKERRGKPFGMSWDSFMKRRSSGRKPPSHFKRSRRFMMCHSAWRRSRENNREGGCVSVRVVSPHVLLSCESSLCLRHLIRGRFTIQHGCNISQAHQSHANARIECR